MFGGKIFEGLFYHVVVLLIEVFAVAFAALPVAAVFPGVCVGGTAALRSAPPVAPERASGIQVVTTRDLAGHDSIPPTAGP